MPIGAIDYEPRDIIYWNSSLWYMINYIWYMIYMLYDTTHYWKMIYWNKSLLMLFTLFSFSLIGTPPLKGNFGQKWKNYHRCVTYRTVAGKNFRSQNLKEKSAGPFHPLLSSFFVLTFLLTFLNLCTQLLNLSTHFTKPDWIHTQV